jgi:hypothetical protein
MAREGVITNILKEVLTMAEKKAPKDSKILDLGKGESELTDKQLDDVAGAGCQGMSGIADDPGGRRPNRPQ